LQLFTGLSEVKIEYPVQLLPVLQLVFELQVVAVVVVANVDVFGSTQQMSTVKQLLSPAGHPQAHLFGQTHAPQILSVVQHFPPGAGGDEQSVFTLHAL
jgi:hypothetical protein